MPSIRTPVVESAAVVAAVASGAYTAQAIVTVAQGETSGAPGLTRALSRVGKIAGGGMMNGVAIIGASAAFTGLTVYKTISLLDTAR